jgi:hypothetical protein
MSVGRTRLPQPVQKLTMNWTTRVPSSAWAKRLSSSLCVQTSSDVHPASSPMGTGGGGAGNALSGPDADHPHPHLVPWLRMSMSCTSSPPWRLRGVTGFSLHYVSHQMSTRVLFPRAKSGQSMTLTAHPYLKKVRNEFELCLLYPFPIVFKVCTRDSWSEVDQ